MTSIICVIALIVTSITAWDVTGVSADTKTTVYQTSDEGRADLLSEVSNGEINFALNKEASVSRLTTAQGGTNLGIITNGKFENGNSPNTTIEVGKGVTEDRWVEVDFGKAYDSSKIDRVVAMYRTLNSGPTTQTVGSYIIQYSLNGTDYVDIAEVSGLAGGANAIYLDKITMTAEQLEAIPYTRFVRIYATRDLSAYGLMIKGLAVLTDGETKVSEVGFQEVEMLDDPVSLTVTSSDYEQLEYTFEASANDTGDYAYYAYVDGAKKDEPVSPGQSYVVTGLTAGTHVVKIVAEKGAMKSLGITESVEVVDTKSLLTSDRNFAIGKVAEASSNRGEINDLETHITDGNLTSMFRTAQADTEATITIDLGQNYKLDVIEKTVAFYNAGRYPQNYTEAVAPDNTYVETGLTGGNHTVKIVAFKGGIASEGITESVQVSDPKDLIATDRNIALGRKAVSSSTRVEIVNGEEVPDNIENLTDGKLNTQFRTLQTDSEANIVIDLGANYKINIIELVAMSYLNDRYAKEYSIDYSEDGEYFETVCTATGDSTFQYSKINLSDCTLSSVRYVRVNVSKPYAENFGFQFYEIAVITKDKSLDDTDFTLNQYEYTYTGEEIMPDVTFTFGDTTLQPEKDYVIKGTDNINVGTATAVIEGAGSYAGSKTVKYEIIPANIGNATVSTSFDDEGKLDVSVSYNDKPLEYEKDYTYTTEKNADGDMLIKVSATGNNFVGEAEKVVPITEFPVTEVANVNVISTEENTIHVSFENPDTFAGDRQLYDVYLDDVLADEN